MLVFFLWSLSTVINHRVFNIAFMCSLSLFSYIFMSENNNLQKIKKIGGILRFFKLPNTQYLGAGSIGE